MKPIRNLIAGLRQICFHNDKSYLQFKPRNKSLNYILFFEGSQMNSTRNKNKIVQLPDEESKELDNSIGNTIDSSVPFQVRFNNGSNYEAQYDEQLSHSSQPDSAAIDVTRANVTQNTVKSPQTIDTDVGVGLLDQNDDIPANQMQSPMSFSKGKAEVKIDETSQQTSIKKKTVTITTEIDEVPHHSPHCSLSKDSEDSDDMARQSDDLGRESEASSSSEVDQNLGGQIKRASILSSPLSSQSPATPATIRKNKIQMEKQKTLIQEKKKSDEKRRDVKIGDALGMGRAPKSSGPQNNKHNKLKELMKPQLAKYMSSGGGLKTLKSKNFKEIAKAKDEQGESNALLVRQNLKTKQEVKSKMKFSVGKLNQDEESFYSVDSDELSGEKNETSSLNSDSDCPSNDHKDQLDISKSSVVLSQGSAGTNKGGGRRGTIFQNLNPVNFKQNLLKQKQSLRRKRTMQNTQKISEIKGRRNSQKIDMRKSKELDIIAQNSKKFGEFGKNFNNMIKRIKVKTSSKTDDKKHQEQNVQSIIVTQDDKMAICILQGSADYKVTVKGFRLNSNQVKFEFCLEGGHDVRAFDIAQTSDSSEFCIPYYDTGVFKLKIFRVEGIDNLYVRNIRNESAVNRYLEIPESENYHGGSISSFQNSCIHCKYIDKFQSPHNRVLFVNLFDIHTHSNMNFRYHINLQEGKRFTDKHTHKLQNCSPKNWPMNLHHDEKFDIYYVIYREGQCITLNSSNERLKKDLIEQTQLMKQNVLQKQSTLGKSATKTYFQSPNTQQRKASIFQHKGTNKQTALELINEDDEHIEHIHKDDDDDECEEAQETFCRQGVGYSILFKNMALITRHSGEILFYRRERIDDYGQSQVMESKLEKYKWKEYYSLPLEAQISHTKNQDFFIICTLEKIFQYTIDKETLEPIMLGIMYNNMDCRKVISSPKQQAYLSFNMNQPDFRIYNRKYQHCFKAEIDNFHHVHHQHDDHHDEDECEPHSWHACKYLAQNLEGSKSFCVADETSVKFYDGQQFEMLTNHRIEPDLKQFEKMSKKHVKNDQLDVKILSMKVSGTKPLPPGGIGFGGFQMIKVDKYLALQVGLEFSRKQKLVFGIFLYELDYTFNDKENHFEVTGSRLLHTYKLKKEMQNISNEFHFITNKQTQTEIMIVDEQCIYLYDFSVGDESLRIILDFNQEFGFKMSESPQIFVLNKSQTVAFISNTLDTLMIDLVPDKEGKSPTEKIFEIDNIFMISNVKKCISADNKFFIVANQRADEKGLFLLSVDENPFSEKAHDCKVSAFDHSFKEHHDLKIGQDNSPEDSDSKRSSKKNVNFLISDPHLYNIGDVDIYCTTGKKRNIQKQATDVLADEYKQMQESLVQNRFKRKISSMFTKSMQLNSPQKKTEEQVNTFKEQMQGKVLSAMIEEAEKIGGQSKELIISFKTQLRNTYNFIVIDIETNPNRFVFNHEIFHVYEQYITGILLFSNDFLTITNEKLCAVSVSRGEGEREIHSQDDFTKRKFHSLQECSYLQLHKNNHITLRYPDNNENKENIEILIQDQYQNGEKTEYFDLFKICIEEMSFWELLLLRNLYYCTSTEKMIEMIKEQPNSRIFFKSFLELDMSNLASLLSFDNKIVETLLSEKNINEMNHEYPVIYKIKSKKDKELTYTAIDLALNHNQLQAVNIMISYIVKYQNNPIYSYIFDNNFSELIIAGAELFDLLNSQIFYYELPYDDNIWPQEDFNPENLIMPYNEEVFTLRNNYHHVIGRHLKRDKQTNQENDQLYKITYHVNLLPRMGEFINLMDDLGEYGDIKLFACEAVKNLAKYKWTRKESNAHNVHRISSGIFLVYLITFFLYINLKYNQHLWHSQPEKYYPFCIIMFTCNTYMFFYEFKQAFNTGWFYFIDFYNYNDMLFIFTGYFNILIQIDPFKWNMGTDNFTAKLLNIIFVVSMLGKSFFYLRMVESFTKIVIMIINVIGDLKFFILFYAFILLMLSQILGILGVGNISMMPNKGQRDEFLIRRDDPNNISRYPGDEYKDLPPFLKNFLIIMRFSLGDFDFDAVGYLSMFDQRLFYVTWMLITMMTCIIILNFVIAEVNQSYERVNSDVDEQVLREKVQLIAESEDMMGMITKYNQELYPRYLVVRSVVERDNN